MRKALLVAIAFGLPALLFAQQKTVTAQTELAVKTEALRTALLAKDSVALTNLLAADVSYGHTNGLIQTKAELVRSVMGGEQDYKTIEPSDTKVRVYDKAGVVTMKSKVAMLYNGSPLDLNMAVTLVWIKSGTEWKLVARQSVKL